MPIMQILYYSISLVLGCFWGYYYGLFLVQQGKALSFSVLQPLLRLSGLLCAGALLLHYGLIAFILFFISFISTLWYSILRFS